MRWFVVGSPGGSGLQRHIPNKHVEYRFAFPNASQSPPPSFHPGSLSLLASAAVVVGSAGPAHESYPASPLGSPES